MPWKEVSTMSQRHEFSLLAQQPGTSLRALGYHPVPAPSTITAILRRTPEVPFAEPAPPRAWQRFAHATPNALWQMDFKGHFALLHGRCHPLTVLDDCSRFALCLHACPNEQGLTV